MIDLQTDLLLLDGGRPVTLRQNRAGTVSTIAVRNGIAGPATSRAGDVAAIVPTPGTEQVWHLNALDVGPGGILPGDTLDDGTDRWLVLTAALTTLGTRWHCLARRQLV